MQRILIKKRFVFTVRSVCFVKAVHRCVEKFSQGRSKDADDETEVRKWQRQQTKDLDTLAKRWDKGIDVGGRYVEK
jgi:hypothetical protein